MKLCTLLVTTLVVAGALLISVLCAAPFASAQNRFNCSDFQFQEDAQKVLDRILATLTNWTPTTMA